MGADIHSFAEVRRNGKWNRVTEPLFSDYGTSKTTEPFGWRSYSVFGFLADVRNYSHCPVLAEPRGLPDDSEYLNTPLVEPQNYSYSGFDNGTAYTRKGEIECDADYHSLSWFTLKELLDFEYDKTFEDRRTTVTTTYPNGAVFSNGAAEAEEGQGNVITFREHLGEGYFDHLETLKSLGTPEDVRVVFWFDN